MDKQQHDHDDEQENGLDPDWWIDDDTTRAEYNERTRRHAAKWRDDWH